MSLQGQITLPTLNLTPCPRMRKKRPSYSPAKNANFETPVDHGYSSNPSTSQKPAELSSTDHDALNTGLASLQFQEFSWNDGQGGYKGVGAAHFGMLYEYIKTLYPEVQTIEERVPYLVIWCKESIPESSKRPFLIAGLLGVWLVDGPDNLPREFTGEYLGNLGIILDLDDDLAEDVRKYHIPKTETLFRLVREHFPDALALSYVSNKILVELPELPPKEHGERLQKFPGRFGHIGPRLFYHNGLRTTGHQNKRLKEPKPERLDGQCDDSDYVATQGNFQPGSMLCDDSGNIVSAGVLVQKGNETRLTVSIHCWQKELDEIPEKMGDLRSFRVRQGKTHVGYVSSKLGKSDIGLATLNNNAEFRNRFLDLPGGPTQLLHSDNLRENDVYMIDSFTTGRQGALLCQGKRLITEEDKKKRVDSVLKGKQKDLPDAGKYLAIVQGIYATSDPMAYGEPIIRAGCCGSALVQLVESSIPPAKTAARSGLRGENVELGFVNEGKIGGFMHWSDLQEKTTHVNVPRLYCYAEVTDPLIEAGWEVAKTAEKRKRSDSEDPFMD